jgi:hypothetical protein
MHCLYPAIVYDLSSLQSAFILLFVSCYDNATTIYFTTEHLNQRKENEKNIFYIPVQLIYLHIWSKIFYGTFPSPYLVLMNFYLCSRVDSEGGWEGWELQWKWY